jgi:chorismate mutase-like protein
MFKGDKLMSIADFRIQINDIDNNIVDLLGNRFQVVRKVAEKKESGNIPVMQPNRIQEVKSRCKERASRNNVREEFIEALYQMIIEEACRIEYEYMNSNSDKSEKNVSSLEVTEQESENIIV